MLIFYNVFVTELSVALLSTDNTMSLSNIGTLCDDLAATPGSYTYLQINDGINYEVVKVTGCTDGVLDILRGIGETEPTPFPIGACVSFRLNMPTLEDFTCQLSCTEDTDTVCNLTTATPDDLDIERSGCSMNVDFIPYIEGEGIDITGKEISTELCSLPATSELDNASSFIVCRNNEQKQVSFAVLTEKLGACGDSGTPATGVQSVAGGDQINVSGTAENPIVNLDEIQSGGFSFFGMTFNAFGQLVAIPASEPSLPPPLTDGIFAPASVEVVGGVIVDIIDGGGVIGVASVVALGGGGVFVDNTDPNNPVLSLPDSALAAGTYAGISFDDKGVAQGFMAGSDPVIDIDTPIGSKLLVTEPSPGEFLVDHEDSALSAGNNNGVVTDDKGHVIGVTLPFIARWVGDAAGTGVVSAGLIASVVSNIMTLTFNPLPPNASYQIIVTDDSNAVYPVTARGGGAFDIDTTAATGQIYVSVLG